MFNKTNQSFVEKLTKHKSFLNKRESSKILSDCEKTEYHETNIELCFYVYVEHPIPKVKHGDDNFMLWEHFSLTAIQKRVRQIGS